MLLAIYPSRSTNLVDFFRSRHMKHAPAEERKQHLYHVEVTAIDFFGSQFQIYTQPVSQTTTVYAQIACHCLYGEFSDFIIRLDEKNFLDHVKTTYGRRISPPLPIVESFVVELRVCPGCFQEFARLYLGEGKLRPPSN